MECELNTNSPAAMKRLIHKRSRSKKPSKKLKRDVPNAQMVPAVLDRRNVDISLEQNKTQMMTKKPVMKTMMHLKIK